MVKIKEKIEQRIADNERFYSLEFFPPRTTNGAMNLIERFDRMSSGGPLFIDLTWGAGGGDPANMELETSTMHVSKLAQKYCGLDVLMHLTAAGHTREQLRNVLQTALDNGICNILALRGDAHKDGEEVSFKYAIHFVKFIREEFGDQFCIGVAGYPKGHPASDSYEDDIKNLKKKVDAGSDFVITQLFFHAEDYFRFLKDCRAAGITVPILPGVMPIQGFASLRHLTALSQLEVPQSLMDRILPYKDNDEEIRRIGVELCTDMVKKLLADPTVPVIHFYTLNREVATNQVLANTGLYRKSQERSLPWSRSVFQKRGSQEEIRPVYWANRPKSYLLRTDEWDDFPNGHWGDSASPAFGDLNDYHLFQLYESSDTHKKTLRKLWGEELTDVNDVKRVFVKFLSGEIKKFPWAEGDLSMETNSMILQLIMLCDNGLLTINSQPAVNGAPSDDPVYGWGGPGGYVYQKAYVEFFCNKDVFKIFCEEIKHLPQYSYQARTIKGDLRCNTARPRPQAITWGVFPGSEIKQPTIVDPTSFEVWAKESFEIWSAKWGSVYDAGSSSRKVLEDIRDTYYLVEVVDNDYVKSDIFEVFRRVFLKVKQKK